MGCVSAAPDPVLLLAFAALETLLDFWIEALTSSNKSDSRLSNVKPSLSKVEIESADRCTSSWIPVNFCFSSFSTPSIMQDSSSGSRTPESNSHREMWIKMYRISFDALKPYLHLWRKHYPMLSFYASYICHFFLSFQVPAIQMVEAHVLSVQEGQLCPLIY